MGSSGQEKPPKDLSDWKKKVTKSDLEGKTIHDQDLVSASKIGYKQFLLLRVIWKLHKADTIVNELATKNKDWIKEAEKKLLSYQSWATYCESVELPEARSSERSGEPSKATPEGNFAIVRHYQREVTNSKPEVNPQAFDTPIAARTRGKSNQSSKFSLEDDSPSRTPSSGPSPSPGPSPPNTISREIDKLLYPPTKDEQIVNTALIVFLNALTTHFDFYSNWTLHRKPFVATFENAQFEARTDGYLDSPGENPRVLIEVKPVLRFSNLLAIQMQESAQMVAWIKSDGDQAQRTNTTRFHISQDRHEVFVTVAKYNQKYLDYLNNKLPLSLKEDPSFLTMHQYGPWNTSKKSSVKELGAILLAITLRAEEEIKNEKRAV